ncbi:Uracil-regulated protein 1 [Clydaea vesicula]|uniref:Uracil-regulated protein 1 n=1 Tax=Clydaea vesicula TaxID=447962 RepID=A0AAD5TTX5_9FUNG|nr:Uracil-regulated protein 1 [Clydaea vesicula]
MEQALLNLTKEIQGLKTNQTLLLEKVEAYQRETSHEIRQLKAKSSNPGLSQTYDSENESESSFKPSVLSTSPSQSSRFSTSYTGASSATAKRTENVEKQLYNHRIVLTTYPGQVGVSPIPMKWGSADPSIRGPIVVSRHPDSIKLRNAVGAHGGSYSVYRALSIAMRELDPDHKPDLYNTEPVFKFGPHKSWNDPNQIVSLDPFGADIGELFKGQLKKGLDIRPTIAITRAHMRLAEIEDEVKRGLLKVDGKIVCSDAGELMVTKGAIEPVWWLPGVARRFGVEESTLRRALFEDTGGMYPELITRPDLKVFLPPIGGLSIYIFGNPAFLSDPSKKLTVRVHDECNGSAQEGGVGLIVYFRKEGRALGEVTKYLVYNARKRAEGGDTAALYFKRTENVAGVKDMRFQGTMPDVLHYLGITKIDRMISMSNMKYDAIVGSGIKIIERIPIPDGMLPPDSQVEIDAKVASGYFSHNQVVLDLESVKGRAWEDVEH